EGARRGAAAGGLVGGIVTRGGGGPPGGRFPGQTGRPRAPATDQGQRVAVLRQAGVRQGQDGGVLDVADAGRCVRAGQVVAAEREGRRGHPRRVQRLAELHGVRQAADRQDIALADGRGGDARPDPVGEEIAIEGGGGRALDIGDRPGGDGHHVQAVGQAAGQSELHPAAVQDSDRSGGHTIHLQVGGVQRGQQEVVVQGDRVGRGGGGEEGPVDGAGGR